MEKRQQQKNKDTANYELNLPFNREAEESTIGALLIEKTAIYEVIDFLKPEMFYDNFCRAVYQAILNVEAISEVDLVTIGRELQKSDEKVDMYKLATISTNVASASHIDVHARLIYQDYLRRELMLLCAKTLAEASDMSIDISDLIDTHTSGIDGISNKSDVSETRNIASVAVESFKAYQERAEKAKQGTPTGIHTGLNQLDKNLHGLQKGGIYILAARPAMGKTAFMLNMARKTARHGNHVAIFSLEMTKRSLVDRLVIAESGINANDFRSGRLIQQEFEMMATAQENISHLPIEINDNSAMSIQRIKAEAKKLKRKDKCDMIMIDYLQLIDTQGRSGRSRNDEVAALSRAVKIMAKDLDVPVVLLSQLSRDVEKRGDKIPMLSDLRDSGAIEQDADVVMFIHREAYYDIHADKNKGIIRIAKSREGKTGDIEFFVNENITDFRDNEFSIPTNVDFNTLKRIENNPLEEDEPLPF